MARIPTQGNAVRLGCVEKTLYVVTRTPGTLKVGLDLTANTVGAGRRQHAIFRKKKVIQ